MVLLMTRNFLILFICLSGTMASPFLEEVIPASLDEYIEEPLEVRTAPPDEYTDELLEVRTAPPDEYIDEPLEVRTAPPDEYIDETLEIRTASSDEYIDEPLEVRTAPPDEYIDEPLEVRIIENLEANMTLDRSTNCDPAKNHWSCCTKSNPCGESGGDCDNDAECQPGLKCGKDNCRAIYGDDKIDSKMDCCYNPCDAAKTVEKPNWSCCSKSNRCAEAGGDCDSDADCQPGLKCGKDNCRKMYDNYNIHSQMDCCHNAVYGKLIKSVKFTSHVSILI